MFLWVIWYLLVFYSTKVLPINVKKFSTDYMVCLRLTIKTIAYLVLVAGRTGVLWFCPNRTEHLVYWTAPIRTRKMLENHLSLKNQTIIFQASFFKKRLTFYHSLQWCFPLPSYTSHVSGCYCWLGCKVIY